MEPLYETLTGRRTILEGEITGLEAQITERRTEIVQIDRCLEVLTTPEATRIIPAASIPVVTDPTPFIPAPVVPGGLTDDQRAKILEGTKPWRSMPAFVPATTTPVAVRRSTDEDASDVVIPPTTKPEYSRTPEDSRRQVSIGMIGQMPKRTIHREGIALIAAIFQEKRRLMTNKELFRFFVKRGSKVPGKGNMTNFLNILRLVPGVIRTARGYYKMEGFCDNHAGGREIG